jgi:hypothetical protein
MTSHWKWKEGWCAVVLALAVAACLPVQAVGRLHVELRQARPADRSLAGSDGTMEVVLTNTGDQVIEVLQDDIPYQNKRGRLTGSAFEIIDPEGREADYSGIFVDYVNGVLRTLPLAPGRKEVRRVNIVRNYKVSAGQRYTVSLHPVRYLDRPRSAFSGASNRDLMALMKSVETNRIHVWIDPSLDIQSIRVQGRYAPPAISHYFFSRAKPCCPDAVDAASHAAESRSHTFAG